VGNTLGNTASVLVHETATGSPAPSFAAVNSPARTEPIAVAGGDDNPGLGVSAFSSTVSALLHTTPTGSSTPSFAAAANFSPGAEPLSVAVGDFNGDGQQDPAFANPLGTTSDSGPPPTVSFAGARPERGGERQRDPG
jgi:hypothetical protein